MRLSFVFAVSAAAVAAACTTTDEYAGDAVSPAPAAKTSVDFSAMLVEADRSDADRARDGVRKPVETLKFFQVRPGDSVFEIEAGGGYFTEIYSVAVGPNGSVAMQNFQAFADYAKDEIAARLDNDRLSNVRVTISLHDDLDAADSSIDVATWVQGPHELYYKPTPDADFGDPAGSFAEIYRIVKPGGVFGVIDHAAVAGAPTSVGNDLHRIDPAHVIELATNAGFVLDAESDFLANPEDDRTDLVFSEARRGKSDQFALRFRKPE